MDQCGIQCMEADIGDRHSLHEPMDMVDVVYNLASPPPRLKEEDYSKFNNGPLMNLLAEANEHGVKVFVHLSCLDVYGFGGGCHVEANRSPKPEMAYQKAKLEAERIVTGFGKDNKEMKVAIVRAARPVGPRDQTVTLPILRMMEGGKVVLPQGSGTTMSLVHPKDIAQSLLRASVSNPGEVVLVKSFEASVEELARRLVDASGSKVQLKQQGMFGGKTLISGYASEQVRAGLSIDAQDAWKRISYAPNFTIENTVEETIGWYRKEPWVTKDVG